LLFCLYRLLFEQFYLGLKQELFVELVMVVLIRVRQHALGLDLEEFPIYFDFGFLESLLFYDRIVC